MKGEKESMQIKTPNNFSATPKPPLLSSLCHYLKQLGGPMVITELWGKEKERESLMKDHGGGEIARHTDERKMSH